MMQQCPPSGASPADFDRKSAMQKQMVSAIHAQLMLPWLQRAACKLPCRTWPHPSSHSLTCMLAVAGDAAADGAAAGHLPAGIVGLPGGKTLHISPLLLHWRRRSSGGEGQKRCLFAMTMSTGVKQRGVLCLFISALGISGPWRTLPLGKLQSMPLSSQAGRPLRGACCCLRAAFLI